MEEDNLVKHARYELKRAGLFDADSDYGGMLGESTMKLIKCFSEEGHSGMSAAMQIFLFKTLADFKPLSPLTDDPDEWFECSKGVWQNKRSSDCFSSDGGKTYHSVEDKNRTIKYSKSATP